MTYLELPFRGKVEDKDLWNHLTRWKKVGWVKYAICPRERIIFVKSILPKISTYYMIPVQYAKQYQISGEIDMALVG